MSTANAPLWRVRGEDSQDEGQLVELSRLAQAITDGVLGEEIQVRGPSDRDWRLVGEHPQLEEYLPPQPVLKERSYDDAEMDMTPMIDVTFQLLIFFMITASFIVQKTLDMPAAKPDEQKGAKATTIEQLKQDNVVVLVKSGGTITVDDQPVAAQELVDVLKKAAKQHNNVEMVMDVEDDVEHETVVQVLDAAGGAQIERVLYVQRGVPAASSPPSSAKSPPPPPPSATESKTAQDAKGKAGSKAATGAQPAAPVKKSQGPPAGPSPAATQ